jgi:hypothetical protein
LIFVTSFSGQVWNSSKMTLKNRLINEKCDYQEIDDKLESEKQQRKTNLLVSVGMNYSSYIHQESEWQLGYNLGLTFNFKVYKKLSISLPFSYARINTAPQNVEGRFYSDDGYIYKMFVEGQISVGFLEFPILFSYKFLTVKSYNFSFTFGPGLVIAIKDFSTTEDVLITDEIIGMHHGVIPLEPAYVLSSGFNINSGIRFNVSRFYIDFLYILYPYEIKEINKLNTISLRLGIDIE